MTIAPAELSIVVPTYNERANIPELIERIRRALPGIAWEVIVVDDDSPDGTGAAVRALYVDEPRVRCLSRIGRRGLSSACIEGWLSSSAPFLAVMDADLQHDPAQLREMFEVVRQQQADLVIASRYMAGGEAQDWQGRRLWLSRLATRLSAPILKHRVSDPMSGFFLFRRAVFDGCVRRLSGLGFKILADMLASLDAAVRIREVPCRFGVRHAGESKLSANVEFEYLLLLLDKLVGRYVPARFIAFAGVGLVGVGVHFLVLSSLFRGVGTTFLVAQGLATVVAMVFNFSVNNVLTYTGHSLKSGAWVRGLLSFMLICSAGVAANVGVAAYLFGRATPWPLAAVTGIALSSVWNYVVSARFTWKVKG